MKKKKSRFWSFWLSFIPGCVEMYMGFMKYGISLFAAFIAIIAVSTFLNIGELMFIDVVVWVYAYFHARNLVHMEEADLAMMQDDYMIHIDNIDAWKAKLAVKYRSIIAILMILFGGVMLLRVLYDMLRGLIPEVIRDWLRSVSNYMPQVVVSIGIIAVGLWLIRGKKQELLEDHNG